MNKVWTYLISKELSPEQIESLFNEGKHFAKHWTAHEQQLQASFSIFKNRIIVVEVNEEVHNASGCSIDKLLRFIKDAEKKYEIELLNRLLVAYKTQQDKIEVVHSSQIKTLLQSGLIGNKTIIYNIAASNSTEYANWEQALENTWLKKYLEETKLV